MFYNIKIGTFLWLLQEKSIPLHPISDERQDSEVLFFVSENFFGRRCERHSAIQREGRREKECQV